MKLVSLALSLLVGACGPESPAPPAPSEPATPAPAGATTTLQAAIDALMARPEHAEPLVTVQHCEIAVEGIVPGITRSVAEAEALTAELYARVLAGADFDAFVHEYSDDEHPGIYAMCLGEPPAPDVYPREAMTLGLGDVAWRLAVGEVGVMRYDGERFDVEARSPFGYHLVKRLK